ncbi:hypothetical protein DNAM_420 [Pseudomonas phage BroderSalsa]|nr:hypothetical protein DNAM_420 [Pseudomonas phage BroderSalsa]
MSRVEQALEDKTFGELLIEAAEEVDVVDEDWLAGVSCNSEEPEMCESCQ